MQQKVALLSCFQPVNLRLKPSDLRDVTVDTVYVDPGPSIDGSAWTH